MNRMKAGTVTVALAFIAIGTALLLDQFGFWQWHMLRYVGPLILIALGLEIIIMRALSRGEAIRYGGWGFVVAALAIMISLGYTGAETFAPNIFSSVRVMPVSGQLPVDPGVTHVEIDVSNATVRLYPNDVNEVRFNGQLFVLGDEADDAWAAERQGSTLVLRQRPIGWTFGWGLPRVESRPQLNIDVPAGLNVSVRTSNSSVHAEGISASELYVRTSNGSVRVDDVTGPVTIRTSNGSINAVNVHGSLHASTSNASITAESPVQDDWRLSTSNGRITVRVPRATDATVRASTSNASISGTVPWQLSSRDRSGDAVLGSGKYTVRLETSNGSIQVDDTH